jgi:transcriptional regulator with XRE-family HTH domain
MTAAFGDTLREWRQIRRMSQMDLGLSAGVSPRHISFLETGRSRPSRGMILRLCDELEVPRAARNHFLTAAGLAPAFDSRPMEEAEMAPLRQAMNWMLQQHAPYPAMAVDRHWTLIALNPTAAMMFDSVGVGIGDSLITELTDNARLRDAIENLAEVERLSVMRLRTELGHFGRDPVLEVAISRLQERIGQGDVSADGVMPAVIPARYRLNGVVLSFFTTISQFGATGDIAMSELRIEMMFPADEDTRRAVFALAAQG